MEFIVYGKALKLILNNAESFIFAMDMHCVFCDFKRIVA
jgi:hypothetical protein